RTSVASVAIATQGSAYTSSHAETGGTSHPSAASVPAIIRPEALLVGVATPAVAYRGQLGGPYRYEMPTITITQTPPPAATAPTLMGADGGAPAPAWPFTAGGVSVIVIGCVLAVVDRTLRTTEASEEPML
ncbi:MAG: hypothetical protein WCI67_21120, partial [Chloroflexales bacterium]